MQDINKNKRKIYPLIDSLCDWEDEKFELIKFLPKNNKWRILIDGNFQSDLTEEEIEEIIKKC